MLTSDGKFFNLQKRNIIASWVMEIRNKTFDLKYFMSCHLSQIKPMCLVSNAELIPVIKS